jgi:hypothetical protein
MEQELFDESFAYWAAILFSKKYNGTLNIPEISRLFVGPDNFSLKDFEEITLLSMADS